MLKRMLQSLPPLYALLRAARARATWLSRAIRRTPERHANPYATHVPVLLALGQAAPIRRVAEFGCGIYSTLTFLDRTAFPALVALDSFESDPAWSEQVVAAAAGDPRLRLTVVPAAIGDYVAQVPLHGYDLIFVDDSLRAGERAATIRAIAAARPLPGVVVIHDFEQPLYRRAAAGFARRYSFTSLNPHTGVAWDGAPVDVGRLGRLRRTIARHAARVQPDARAEWVRLLQQTHRGAE